MCNIAITDPQRFYGRTQELQELHGLLDAAIKPVPRGLMGFVQGYLKSGKTSLVHIFLGELLEQRDPACLTTYIEAWRKERAEDFFKRLCECLAQAMREFSVRVQEERSNLITSDLQETLRNLTSSQPLVIAIDEAPRLFDAASADESSRDQLIKFASFIAACPRLLVLWIGPTSAARVLPPPFQELLLSRSVPIRLSPFSERDVHRLLSAEKLDLVHRIHVQASISQQVHRSCSGDPFWVGSLAHVMWEEASKRHESEVRYLKEDVERSQQRLWLGEAAFTLRFTHMSEGNKSVARTILNEFGKRLNQEAAVLFTSEEITALLETRAVDCNSVRDALDELEAVGLVVRLSDNHSFKYSLSAPIMEGYVVRGGTFR